MKKVIKRFNYATEVKEKIFVCGIYVLMYSGDCRGGLCRNTWSECMHACMRDVIKS